MVRASLALAGPRFLLQLRIAQTNSNYFARRSLSHILGRFQQHTQATRSSFGLVLQRSGCSLLLCLSHLWPGSSIDLHMDRPGADSIQHSLQQGMAVASAVCVACRCHRASICCSIGIRRLFQLLLHVYGRCRSCHGRCCGRCSCCQPGT
jgi:hypothetical protein